MSAVKDIVFAKLLGGSGGGGGGAILIGETEVDCSTTSTSDAKLTDVPIERPASGSWMYVVCVRDKNGLREGYFYGSDTLFLPNPYGTPAGNGSYSYIKYYWNTGNVAPAASCTASSSSAQNMIRATTLYEDKVRISVKYSSGLGTINGTFSIKVYAIPNPAGPFLPT